MRERGEGCRIPENPDYGKKMEEIPMNKKGKVGRKGRREEDREDGRKK